MTATSIKTKKRRVDPTRLPITTTRPSLAKISLGIGLSVVFIHFVVQIEPWIQSTINAPHQYVIQLLLWLSTLLPAGSVVDQYCTHRLEAVAIVRRDTANLRGQRFPPARGMAERNGNRLTNRQDFTSEVNIARWEIVRDFLVSAENGSIWRHSLDRLAQQQNERINGDDYLNIKLELSAFNIIREGQDLADMNPFQNEGTKRFIDCSVNGKMFIP